ncbi:MAG: magnesium transporter [Thermodesulfobacteriota bacterium]
MERKELETLKGLLEKRDIKAVRVFLSSLHAADIAELLTFLEGREKVGTFLNLTTDVASKVILETDDSTREYLIASLSKGKLTEIVDEMDTDDATDIIGELPEEEAKIVLEGIDREESEAVQKLLKHEEDTAGGLMQTELVAIKEDATLMEAIDGIRAISEKMPNIHNVFVVAEDNRLVGILPIRKLILNKPKVKVKEIMDHKCVRVRVDLDQEEVARVFQKYNVVSLPVVDFHDRLVGRITIDDVVDVIEEEVFEDFYRMAGLREDDRVFSPTFLSVRKRLPWLFFNLLTAMLAASVVGFFQETIHTVVALAVLMPIVAGMGGNAGTQTLTVIVRGIALGELTFDNARKAFFKEVMVGILNGVAIGTAIAILAYIWKGNFILGLVIGLAMVINMFVAGLTGTIIPLTLRWLKIDPALAAGVFVTTFTDLFGFLSFLGLATLFLRFLT